MCCFLCFADRGCCYLVVRSCLVVWLVVSLGLWCLFGLFWCVVLSFVVLLCTVCEWLFECINSVVIACYLSVWCLICSLHW